MDETVRLLLLILILSVGCSSKTERADTRPVKQSTQSSGIDLDGFDTAVRPQDDFYRYVNGTWLEKTTLPADKSNYGSFSKVADEAEIQLRAIVEELKDKEIESGTAEQKIRDYYAAYLAASDSESVDLTGLKSELEMIDAIKSVDDFYAVSGRLAPIGVRTPIQISMYSDLKDPNTYTVYLSQSGLTLRDRDYYLKDEERFSKARELYLAYADTILGFGEYKEGAQALLEFETQLARVSWTREERRDPNKKYNPKSVGELEKLAPKIAWTSFLDATTVPRREQYVVGMPSFFEGVNAIVAKTDIETLKNYLRFQTISAFASTLGRPAFDASFTFFRQGLRGVKEPRPAWKRALGGMNWSMGELLGQVYVARHFRPDAKARMQTMVDTLIAAYGVSIDELDWMSDPTKKNALEKLSKFTPKIGYPDKWIDYSNLTISQNAVENAKSVSRFDFQRSVDKLDKPVDKSEWGMPPQIVNAYYSPVWNEIVFPAAILQPPFFVLDADEAVNYGAIGAVIGHEMTKVVSSTATDPFAIGGQKRTRKNSRSVKKRSKRSSTRSSRSTT